MDELLSFALVVGLLFIGLGCIGMAYEAGKGITPFTIESTKQPMFPFEYASFSLGLFVLLFFGSIGLYEQWNLSINARIRENVDREIRYLKEDIQKQSKSTSNQKKKKEE